MATIRLIHWKAAEAEERAAHLRDAGYQVLFEEPRGPRFLKELGKDPADAILIDLTRLPSQGRDFGVALRVQKTTRGIPLIFVDGPPEKVERIRKVLPDAVYASWDDIGTAIDGALETPLEGPFIPGSVFEGYAGKSLVQKLGVKAGSVVALLEAPHGFDLGELPDNATLRDDDGERFDLTIFFARSGADLRERIGELGLRARRAPVWIAWPKAGSSLASDLTPASVRRCAGTAGLVDYKICSIDDTWSGLLFTWRASKN